MGLFNNYLREGPGVRKDEKKKKGVARFWEMFTRHYGDLLKLNLWLIGCCVPLMVVLFLILIGWDTLFAGYLGMLLLAALVLCITAVPIGAALTATHAALIRILRDEPTFLWHKYKEDFKKNFKQSMPVGIVSAFLLVLQSTALMFYVGSENANLILSALCIFGILVLFCVTIPLYMQIIFIDLPLGTMLKNSVLIMFGKAKRMLPAGLVLLATFILGTMVLPSLVFAGIALFFGISTILLIADMWAWPVVDTLFNISEQQAANQAEKEKQEAMEELRSRAAAERAPSTDTATQTGAQPTAEAAPAEADPWDNKSEE